MDPGGISPLHRHALRLSPAGLSRAAVVQHAATYVLWERLYGGAPAPRALDGLVRWLRGGEAPAEPPKPAGISEAGLGEGMRADPAEDKGGIPLSTAEEDSPGLPNEAGAVGSGTAGKKASPPPRAGEDESNPSETTASVSKEDEEETVASMPDDSTPTPPPGADRERRREKGKRPRVSSGKGSGVLKRPRLEDMEDDTSVEKYAEKVVGLTAKLGEASSSEQCETSAYDSSSERSGDVSNPSSTRRCKEAPFTVSTTSRRSSSVGRKSPNKYNIMPTWISPITRNDFEEDPNADSNSEAFLNTKDPAYTEGRLRESLTRESSTSRVAFSNTPKKREEEEEPVVEKEEEETPDEVPRALSSAGMPADTASTSRVAFSNTPKKREEEEEPVVEKEEKETPDEVPRALSSAGMPANTASTSRVAFSTTPKEKEEGEEKEVEEECGRSVSSVLPTRADTGSELPSWRQKKGSLGRAVGLYKGKLRTHEESPLRSAFSSISPPPRSIERYPGPFSEFELPHRVVGLNTAEKEKQAREEAPLPPRSKSPSNEWRSRSQRGREKGAEKEGEEGTRRAAQKSPGVRVKDEKRGHGNYTPAITVRQKKRNQIQNSIPNEFVLPRAFSAGGLDEGEARKTNPSVGRLKARRVGIKNTTLTTQKDQGNSKKHSKSEKTHKKL